MAYDVVVVGAGPSGLMAGITAAGTGASVAVLEHKKEAGLKLLICGKGRCNITNDCDINEMIANIPGNGVFLHSCLRAFDKDKLLDFFHENGLATKVERGGRVFPESDKSQDVKNLLLKVLASRNGKLLLNSEVTELVREGNLLKGVRLGAETFLPAKSVILCAGGASYPGTGSDGSGFKLAAQCGHTIVEPKPSLVPLEVDFTHLLPTLQGLSLRNVEATVLADGRKNKKEFGEMLFTHFGLSGPIILTLSNIVKKHLDKKEKVEISIDLKPALDEEILDKRLQRDFAKYSRKQIKNSLGDLVPASLIPILLQEAGIDADKFINQLTKAERRSFLKVLKDLRFPIKRTRPLTEAIVTAGGVATSEINPKTMRSKLIDNLYFAGEVIDIDGYTGGFNLQAAFSTGYVAGMSVCKATEKG